MTNMNFELATRFAERALQQDAGHAGAVECRALIAHQMGEIELCKRFFQFEDHGPPANSPVFAVSFCSARSSQAMY